VPGLLVLVAGCGAGAVAVSAQAPDEEDREACRALLDDLPDSLADLPRRDVDPVDGWGAAWGDPPLVVRCGSTPPAGFDSVSSCTTVNGVDWFIPDDQLEADEPGDLTMTTVHREQYVEVSLPAEHFPPAAALADLSGPVTEHLRATGSCV
jgi:hypothetical protein